MPYWYLDLQHIPLSVHRQLSIWKHRGAIPYVFVLIPNTKTGAMLVFQMYLNILFLWHIPFSDSWTVGYSNLKRVDTYSIAVRWRGVEWLRMASSGKCRLPTDGRCSLYVQYNVHVQYRQPICSPPTTNITGVSASSTLSSHIFNISIFMLSS